MPFSRSRSIESITRSATSALARKAPDCHSIASTSVVLPWSTWAMIATLRRSSRRCMGPVEARAAPREGGLTPPGGDGGLTPLRWLLRYGGQVVGPPAFGTVTREAVPQQIVVRLLDRRDPRGRR